MAVLAGLVPGLGASGPAEQPAPAQGRILYYRNPMGLPDTSPVPKKDPMGMDYVPVYAEAPKPAGEGRILYYRNPMGLPDTSPVPKKDPMGMDYVPVREGEAEASGQVLLTPEKIQKLGVRTEAVERRSLAQTVRAVGLLAPDERRETVVAPRYEGWIERLHVAVTGESVRRGQVLASVHSPEILATSREYRLARAVGMRELAEAALARLRHWGLPPGEIARIRSSRDEEAGATVLLLAPADGVVLERTAVAGQRFMPGEMLYRIVDLSRLWLLVDVYERDLALVRPGQSAQVTVNAWPGETFSASVSFIYPSLDAQTRTAKVRLELDNADGRLKPSMYAAAELAGGDAARTPVLTIPASAVIDSGTRQVALVELAAGRFAPRELRLGRRGEGVVEVLAGLAEGERVVVRANFLIDAESNLRAALGAFGAPASEPAAPAAPAGHGGH